MGRAQALSPAAAAHASDVIAMLTDHAGLTGRDAERQAPQCHPTTRRPRQVPTMTVATLAHLAATPVTPDGSITPQPVGAPLTRLDLAADAGHWRAEREAYAATAKYECRRCGNPISLIDGAWVCVDYTTTAGGLSFCPPDPDAPWVGEHLPRKRARR
jgi:hypothetical protein